MSIGLMPRPLVEPHLDEVERDRIFEFEVPAIDAVPPARIFTRGVVLVLVLQWVALNAWCWRVFSFFNVRVDFAGVSMGWWGMTHGNWNPQIPLWHHTFLADHFELISLPLSFLSKVWPYDFWAFIIQNSFITMGEVAAILLVELFAQRSWWPSGLKTKWITVGLFVMNPWIFWAASDDVHFHAIGMAAAGILVLYFALAQKWVKMSVATVLCLSCADLAGPFLLSVAASILLVGWRQWRFRFAGVLLLITGFGWIKFVAKMGGAAGSNLKLHFGYLLGASARKATSVDVVVAIAKHPVLAAVHLGHAMGSIFGYLSAGGLVGIFSPLGGPMMLTLLEGGLGRKAGPTFGSISMSPWQMIAATYMAAPCSVIAIGWIMSRRGGLGPWSLRHKRAIVSVLLLNTLIWGGMWIPDEVHNINLTRPGTADALSHILKLVPHENQVFGSWAVLGRFGQRQYLRTFPLKVNLHKELGFRLLTPQVDFVVAPWTGLALQGPNQIGILGGLSRDPAVKLVYHKDQVWLFSYNRKPGQNILYEDVSYANIPGSVLPFPTSEEPQAHVTNQGCLSFHQSGGGYLVSRLTQHLPLGTYQAVVSVDSQTPLVLEVLDADTHQLLARSYDNQAVGMQSLILPFSITAKNFYHDPLFKGWWLYHFAQLPPLPEDTVEIRLWSPGGGSRSVCRLSLFQLSAAATKTPPKG